MSTSAAQISAWGNGLALRLTKPMAKTAGVADGSPVRVTVKPGRIIVETEPTLAQMLAAFDPKKHGGEAMAGGAVGVQKLLRAPADGYTLLYGALSETVLAPAAGAKTGAGPHWAVLAFGVGATTMP